MDLLKIKDLQSFSDKCAKASVILAICFVFISFASESFSLNKKNNNSDNTKLNNSIEIISFNSIEDNVNSIEKTKETIQKDRSFIAKRDNFAKNSKEPHLIEPSKNKSSPQKNEPNIQKNKNIQNNISKIVSNTNSDTTPYNKDKEQAIKNDSNKKTKELISVILNKINSIKNYPARARNMNQQGECLLTIRSDNTGLIVLSEITNKSRYPLLNRECNRLAKVLDHFETKIKSNEITINIPIRFSLHNN